MSYRDLKDFEYFIEQCSVNSNLAGVWTQNFQKKSDMLLTAPHQAIENLLAT